MWTQDALKKAIHGRGKMDKITYYYITPEGSQEMMLSRIKKLKWERDCLHETLDKTEQWNAEHSTSETTVVHEELEIELADINAALAWERNRLIRLRGYDESGIPF
jgi:hypothetical protein